MADHVRKVWVIDSFHYNKVSFVNVKGIVHQFTHPHVVPNLYAFLSFAEHKRRYFNKCR